jgi:periplasmic copper chaperone A
MFKLTTFKLKTSEVKTSKIKTFERSAVVLLAAGIGALTVAGVASAHVSIEQSEVTAGAYELITMGVPHGCDGSPTTEVRIQMPESIVAVTPTRNANWDVEKVMVALDEPITDSHGAEITERVSEIVYTAITPLPDGYRDAFTLSLRVPDDLSGPLYFPTVQICEEGEAGWIEIPADGQDAEELELPAPVVEVVAASGDTDGHGGDETATTDPAATDGADGEETAADDAEAADDSSDASSDDSSDGLAIAALVVGVLGLGTGAVAIARTRKS